MPEAILPQEKQPVVFDEFFEMGLGDEVSPFLTPRSRLWAKNLNLRVSLISAGLLLVAFIFGFFFHLHSLSNLFLIGVYFFAGLPSLIESIEDLSKLEINIDVLMTLAAFSSVLIGSPLEGGLLLVLFSISGAMEDAVSDKARSAISSLYKLAPTKACVINSDGSISERSVKDVLVGMSILIKPGEIVPLDGLVIKGTSSLSLVHLTGENLPVTKKMDDDVPAGAHNHEGALTLKVTHTSADSTVARIIQLVTQAQDAKPRLQRWFDRVSSRYATIIILLTFFFALVLPYVLAIPFLGYEGSLYRSLAFLIAASPCALIIATPIAYLSAVSVCAKKGILLKGGITLDALASCTAIAFDKTGTLTSGNLDCLEMSSLNPVSEQKKEQALAIALSMERHAVHPIARAIINYAEKNQSHHIPVANVVAIPGYGLEAVFNIQGKDESVYVGNADHILPRLPDRLAHELKDKIEAFRQEGELVAVMLFDGEIFLFRFADSLRPKMMETIRKLKQEGKWRLLMLTGDHKQNAKKIADHLGIDEYFADLRPEDKLRIVSKVAEERGLAMVGDGINDAPALARATVGICMGQVGSAAAIEAADAVLLHDNLELLGWLMDKGLQTKAIVRQNLFLAFAVILLATTPALLGWIPLWVAVILHEGGTVLVGLNALRLLEK